MTAVLSPNCAAGKCVACVGDGWDPDRDAIAPCTCACHHATHSVQCGMRIAGEQCTSVAVARLEAMCEHEHKGSTLLCEHHRDRYATRQTWCQKCDADGHRCLMLRPTLTAFTKARS